MFESIHSTFLGNIGAENIRVSKTVLEKLGIPITLEDVGGTAGRTITLYLDDGRILLRANGREKYLYKI